MIIDSINAKRLAEKEDLLSMIAVHRALLDSCCIGKSELFSNLLYIRANAVLAQEADISEDVLLCKAMFLAKLDIWGNENAEDVAFASVDAVANFLFKKSQEDFKKSLAFSTALYAWWRFRGPFGLWKTGSTNSRKFGEYREMLRAFGKDKWIQPDYELAKQLACN